MKFKKETIFVINLVGLRGSIENMNPSLLNSFKNDKKLLKLYSKLLNSYKVFNYYFLHKHKFLYSKDEIKKIHIQ
ncbi:MAG TPA: hypothetical protein ENG87_03955 [Candidatus Pacearchaeota archaeon]|nr:hypothetical protein [Candidatus Pacearchaeota archaeon]